MRKKCLLLLLAFALLLTAGLPACAQESAPREDAVGLLYSAEGVYTDSLGNTENYSFYVPQLRAGTPAAQEINSDIAGRFGKLVTDQLESMAGGYSLWSWNVEWHAYWYGSQLFLLVVSDMEGGFSDYAAYGYDFDRECRVTNEMILDELGVSEEEYLENLREKVTFMVEDKFSMLTDEDRERFGCGELLEKTLGWLDAEQPLYIDGSGQPVTIVKLASIAGAEWYYHLATPFSYG